MIERNANTDKVRNKVQIHAIDQQQGIPRNSRNYVRVLTIFTPRHSCKPVTTVVCRFRLAGCEVVLPKNRYGCDESHEDALNWAQAFARLYGIDTIYAGHVAAGA